MKLRGIAVVIALCAVLNPLFGRTIRDIRNNNMTNGKADSIHSARLVYRITSDSVPESTLLIRAVRSNLFRLDFYSGKEHKSVCINKEGGWVRSVEQEIKELSPADIAEVEYDAAFLPFTILDHRVYSEPQKIKSEVVDGISCDLYECHGVKDEEFTVRVWVDTQAQPNHLYKMETNDRGKVTVARFSKYSNYNGVLMPGVIQISNDDGYSTMRLRSAQWNLDIGETVFARPADPNQRFASGITDTDRAANGVLVPISDQEAAKIQQEISDLDIQINVANDVLRRLDEGMRSNQAYEVQLANTEFDNRFYYSYYRHSSWYRHRDRYLRRRAMRDMSRATSKMAKDYESAQKKLVELQMRRGRLLNRLKAAGREVQK